MTPFPRIKFKNTVSRSGTAAAGDEVDGIGGTAWGTAVADGVMVTVAVVGGGADGGGAIVTVVVEGGGGGEGGAATGWVGVVWWTPNHTQHPAATAITRAMAAAHTSRSPFRRLPLAGHHVQY
jgi:hypothetical protein